MQNLTIDTSTTPVVVDARKLNALDDLSNDDDESDARVHDELEALEAILGSDFFRLLESRRAFLSLVM